MNSIKYIFITVVFFLFSKDIEAQNKKIDSLIIELEKHKTNDTIRVNLLYDIAFSSFQKDMNSTELYLEKAEELSNTLNYTKGKAKVLYLKGILENIKSNYAKSLIFFNRSLKHYESIKDQKGIANIYTAFGITHFDQSQYNESLKAYKKALETYEGLGYKRELITILINIANVYSETGEYNKAISNYKRALKLSKAINDEDGAAYVHLNLGVVYTVQGNYPLAIDHYNKALDYYQKVDNTLSITNTLNNLGNVYNSLKKYNKALEYYKQSLSFSLKIENKNQIAINNSSIGDIYLRKKEYLTSLQYYRMSLETSQEINNLKQTSICFHRIGRVNLSLNKPLIARENFVKAKNISEKTNNQYILSECLLGIGETYSFEKQYQKALPFIEKGKEIAEELELLEAQKKASELLFKIYKNTRQYKKAFENHQQYKIFNDSIFNKENIEKIVQLEYEYKYKNELESAEKRELTLTKTVKTTSQNLAKSQRDLLLGVIAFLITTLLLAAIIFFLKLRNEKSKTQNIVIEQKLLRSQMTPHFIFNSLSVLQGMILNKEEKKSVSYLSKFSKLLRIILENSRDKTVLLSQELKAVRNYLALQTLESKSCKYTVSVEDTIDETLFKISPMLIQPFAENAIEHAFTNQQEEKIIDIHLSYLNNDLICKISDNGVGIDAVKKNKNQDKKSLSTTITSERLEMLSKDFKMRGSVMVEDRKKYNEKGTVVTLIIPYILQKP
ncbi:tetratricopeptide (TPR) repeat protein [Aquimarina sp. EL_43]|uniref:tetratricopeptide repeat protein n=1 Tax=unclassified Aquimarina TaxID=2627091 RepID=UPI0018C92665|nr:MULTISPECIES: tetratricopeptide repeat protein [unclassified Aquimarina]MBG6130692.1 tetratricopeptide (TPR) repeat protein [Aquimarina sp. EL_35]MBG6151162.1 tetratricopeptide (TPR) repeat protein [Aquimarina sp. EL_32]MBG6169094.1 tetratricopeptide (TPR) repeat protein [Aquimarina sp. EL_43]